MGKIILISGDYHAAEVYLEKQGLIPEKVMQVLDFRTHTGAQICELTREFVEGSKEAGAVYFSNNEPPFMTMRIMVKEGLISPEDMVFWFFPNWDSETPIMPVINKAGRLDIWPKGFHDALEICLAKLL